MYDTLPSLVERALTGNRKPLEFYLQENSRLPGPRANLELAQDLSHLLAQAIAQHPEGVNSLLTYFVNGDRRPESSTSAIEFTMLCGVISYGICAAKHPDWREQTLSLLSHHATSVYWRVREGVAIAYQHLLAADRERTLKHLGHLATHGDFLQQRAAVAAVAEPPILHAIDIIDGALHIQQLVLERLHAVPASERKNEEFRVLRRTLGYTVSVVTAAAPQRGFALLRECAGWNDKDIRWVVAENLKKRRLAKFVADREGVERLLAS
jgi:hypothetical protein